MKSLARFGLLLLTSLSAVLFGCVGPEPGGPGPDIERALAHGRGSATAWTAQARGHKPATDQGIIAAGYLERLRSGLGSPFRLIDFALNDPRLEEPIRERLAWALLARTLDGRAYRIDPAALDRIGVAGGAAPRGVGRHHLELIEGAVTEAPDPRSGELAVRLAFTLVAAEDGVRPEAPILAARAAALVRDREIARADAERLILAASARGVDPLRLVPVWRAERRFEVEQPPMASLPLASEREAMELAPRLASAILTLTPRLSGTGSRPSAQAGPVPILGVEAATRLAEAAAALNSPPQTAVGVAVGMHRRELLSAPLLDAAGRERRRRFADESWNEERFVAEYARLVAEEGGADEGVARVTLAVAVGLRPFAQEEVWFPGFGGPSNREIEDRFRLAFVRFDDDVPAAWRPFYRKVLDEALGEMQRVLPSLDLRGLGIRFGESRSKSATLAIHDPRQRTIYLPPRTGMGTIAHEIAHDLDWQIALRRYRVRGDYGSDRAVRQGDRLATVVERLTTAQLMPPIPGDTTPVMHARRPAEVFARSIDWFVVVSLAREGRVNGFLSSVQDDVLTGYGTVTPPDITGLAGQALASILDEVSPVYPSTRESFLRGYGPSRALTPYDLVRRVVEGEEPDPILDLHEALVASTDAEPSAERPNVMLAGTLASHFAELETARDAALAAIDAWICQAPSVMYDPGLEVARRRLVAQASMARARGLALHYAGQLAGVDGRQWLARHFYGAPWPSAEVGERVQAVLLELAEQARVTGEVQIPTAAGSLSGHIVPRRGCTLATSSIL